MPYIYKPKRKETIPYKHEDRGDNTYYNSKYWKKLRTQYIQEHPICELCALEGKSVPADEVHHRHFFMLGNTDEERWDLLLDPNNLMSLCKDCHHKVHTYANKKKLSECDHY